MERDIVCMHEGLEGLGTEYPYHTSRVIKGSSKMNGRHGVLLVGFEPKSWLM